MLKKIAQSVLMVLFVGIIGLVVACGNQQDESTDISYGNETDNSCRLELINNTGKNVISLSVKVQGQENVSKLDANPQDAIWECDKTANIFLANNGQSSVNTGAGSIAVKTTVDIIVAFDDNSSATLHNVVVDALPTFKDTKLCFSPTENIVYIEYADSDGNQVSTLAAEQKIVADARAAEEAAKEAAKVQTETQTAPSYNYYGGSTSNQYSESCTGGNIAIR